MLRLVDPRGEPLDRARWVAFRGDEVLASGRTKLPLEPTAEVPPQRAGFELAVTATGFPPLRATLAPTPVERTIVVGEGAAIAGIVRVDGAAPERTFVLSLLGPGTSLTRADLPEPVAGALHLNLTLSTIVESDGMFRFEGLPVGWKGDLRWSGFSLANAPPPDDRTRVLDYSTLAVRAPADMVVLELESPPSLVGRVVSPTTGDPIERPYVTVSWTAGSYGRSHEARRRKDGSFRIPFEHGMPERVHLSVGDSSGWAIEDYEVTIPPGARTYDAGAFAIACGRQVAFRVVDRDGAPIAKAEVVGSPNDSASERPAIADKHGEGTLVVHLGARELVASAFGYEEARAPLPPAIADGAAPVELVLARATTLVLVLPEDALALGVVLEFGDEEPFLARGAPSWRPQNQPANVSLWVRSEPGGFARWSGASDGRYAITGLRPGLAFDVAACDELGTRVGARRVPPLAPGEERIVELDVAAELHGLSGRVVDPDGTPIPGASVSFGVAGSETGRVDSTDRQGRFSIGDLASDRLKIVVSAEGFPVKRFPDVRADSSEKDLALELGREVRVTVVDAAGEPVENLLLEPSRDADAWWLVPPTEEAPGVYVVRAAPRGVIDLFALAGGRRVPARIEAREDAIRVELPPAQTCTVVLTGAIEVAAGSTVVLSPNGDVLASLWKTVDEGAREVRFDRIYPGRYEAKVFRRGSTGSATLCGPVPVDVRADEPTRVELELRSP